MFVDLAGWRARILRAGWWSVGGLALASLTWLAGSYPDTSLTRRLDGVGAMVVTAILPTLTWLAGICTALALARVLLLMSSSLWHRRRRDAVRLLSPPDGPVTVIVPAYNEELGIEATVRSVVGSSWDVRVIVVDDGSADRTAEVVESLGLPEVRLVRQANAGKAAALNAGLRRTDTELVVMLDGDTVLEPGTVAELARPFADPSVGAVSGNVKISNRRGLLGRWQHVEYVIGFNLDRRFYDVMRCMPTVPGAVGAFRTEAVREVGGVPVDTLAEDTDLTMALQRRGWSVRYQDTARAWTEAPQTLRQLWEQRHRWSYGVMQAMWKHRAAVFDRGAGGRLGRRGLLDLALFQVLLPVLAPAIDLFVAIKLVGNPLFGLRTWCGFVLIQLVPAALAFRLDTERLRPLWTLSLQIVVYRQLMYLVVIRSVLSAVAGTALRWHKIPRTGAGAQLVVASPRPAALGSLG